MVRTGSEIITFARNQGYDGALYLGKWREYDVYEPVFAGDDISIVGIPLVILVQGETIRMSSIDEAFEQQEGEE